MPTIPDGATFGLHQVCTAIRPDCASSRRHAGGRQPVRPSLRPVHNRRRSAVRITTAGNAARAAGSRRCSWRTVATRFRPFLVWRRLQGTHSPAGVLYPRLRHAGRKFFFADFWPGPDLLPCAVSGRPSGSEHRRSHLQRKSLGNGSFSSIGNRGKSGPKHPFRPRFSCCGNWNHLHLRNPCATHVFGLCHDHSGNPPARPCAGAAAPKRKLLQVARMSSYTVVIS